MKSESYFKQQAARARQMAKVTSRPEVVILLERLAKNFDDMAFQMKR